MQIAVIGAGPTGLFLALALARRGHRIAVVDRDPGPRPDGSWPRRGVMQFHQSHGFRGQVVDALSAVAPEVLEGLFAAGAVPVPAPGMPGSTAALRCRRAVFEATLRDRAFAHGAVTSVVGHAEGVLTRRGRAGGVRVDGRAVQADLVIDASGRARRAFGGLRGPAESVECAVAYAGREYELRPDAEPGPVNSPIGMAVAYPDYWAIVFVHEQRRFSVLIAYPSDDRPLRSLGRTTVFATAARAIPHVAEWTDPDRARPVGPVLPGAGLRNTYRGQLDEAGRLPLPGFIAVGDAVATTTPLAGRGVALALMQAQELVRLVEEDPRDPASAALALDAWCAVHIRPWFDDHVRVDTDRVRRWSGGEIEFERALPSDLIVAAAQAEPTLGSITGPYEAMLALPESLAAAQSRAKEIYRAGWRPPAPPGPTREELAALCAAAVAA